MLSCIRGRQCDPRALKFENGQVIEDKECGSNLAYAYFVSFIFLCSFLVRREFSFDSSSFLFYYRYSFSSFLLSLADVELVRRRHYGQLWLSYARLVHPWCPPLGRVYQNMGWIRPQRDVIFATNGIQRIIRLIACFLFFCFVGSGKILYTEMFDMLKNMDPPLGFGNKCPYRLAYKKLIRMNMPVDVDRKVQFTSTLFALIRENLSIKMRPG